MARGGVAPSTYPQVPSLLPQGGTRMRKIRLVTLAGVAILSLFAAQAGTTTGHAASLVPRASNSTRRLPSGRPIPAISGGVETSFPDPSGAFPRGGRRFLGQIAPTRTS